MNIIAFSDSHNHELSSSFMSILNESNYIFFLGDGLNSLGELLFNKNFYAVKGNCDYLPFEDEIVVEIDNIKFLLCHGNQYGVKSNKLNLIYHAKELGVDAVVFGHTHEPFFENIDGIAMINPGSLTSPLFGNGTYAFISTFKNKILCKIVEC